MWDTLLGGLLAILGGWTATWYQLRNARKNRMDEIIAERKVTANAQAYSYAKEIESSLIQHDPTQTFQLILSREGWFFNNRLFLPGTFPAKWLSARNDLHKLIRWQKDTTKSTEEKDELEERIRTSITDAILEIYKDMNLKRIEIEGKEKK
jgi:hypothetical protein